MAEPMENMQKDKLPMVIWWHMNQVAFTFQSPEPLSTGADKIIQTLRLDQLDTFLKAHDFQLKPFTKKDVPRPKRHGDGDGDHDRDDDDGKGKQEDEEAAKPTALSQSEYAQTAASDASGLNSRVGKYFFRSASGEGTSAIAFFHVEKTGSAAQDTGWASQDAMPQSTMPQGTMAQGAMPQDAMPQGNMGQDMMPYENDNTLAVVKLVNGNREELQKEGIPPFSAMPNWLNGGTPFGCGTHGCPVTPPIQVTDVCSVTPGDWPFRLSGDIPPEGEADLTVFVLDTLPTSDQITNANQNGTTQNLLLNAMATNMVEVSPFNAVPPAINHHYVQLPAILDAANAEQPATGKDIYGFLVGYPMEDHGTFVAGIVRDIDPRVKIECVRVLNDFGVGDTTTLISAFQDIHDRLVAGTLSHAMINLSLVATPSDEELGMVPYNLTLAEIQPLRDALYASITSLAAFEGVVFAASAGNDSDQRAGSMPSQYRLDARYPAAFAYDTPSGPGISQMIPVGAVNRTGNAAIYSNFPGMYGVATYGGDIPLPDPSTPAQPGSNVVTTYVPESLDAPRGVYTSKYHPGLYHLDPVPPLVEVLPAPEDYPESPNTPLDTWAYWSGTSFATPIISAVAARVLQLGVSGPNVRGAVLAAANLPSNWDRLSPTDSPGGTAQVPLIMAIQCEVSE